MTETDISIATLQGKMAAYQQVRGKTMDFVLRKVLKDLSINLFKHLQNLNPVKGVNQIRAVRLRALARGEGLNIRSAARAFADQKTTATAFKVSNRKASHFAVLTGRGKGRSWFQVAAEREIAIRESAIDFTAASAIFRGLDSQTSFVSKSRKGRTLARGQVASGAENTQASLTWGDAGGPLAEMAAQSMGQPKARAATAGALRDTTKNINVYLERKAAEALQKARLH